MLLTALSGGMELGDTALGDVASGDVRWEDMDFEDIQIYFPSPPTSMATILGAASILRTSELMSLPPLMIFG